MPITTMFAAVECIQSGGLVGMPTETVYGLAGDALNEASVLQIFTMKRRPQFDPLIVHVAESEAAWSIAQKNTWAQHCADAFWPGPLTLVLPRHAVVPDLVTSGMETVAVRCPNHPVALELLRLSGCVLAAPSANLFGAISPTCAEHVLEQFSAVPVLDGGPCAVGVESTVLSLIAEPTILRPGGISAEQIEAVIGVAVLHADNQQHADHLPQQAPGMLKSHYAPQKPLTLLAVDEPWPQDPAAGLLTFADTPVLAAGQPHVELSAAADLAVAAQGLFAGLRQLDASAAKLLYAKLLPNQGLGLAINDRLSRAAGRGGL